MALVKHKHTQELVISLFRKFFCDQLDWPAMVLEQAIGKKLESNTLVELIFRFRSLLLNFLESCPQELIDNNYFSGLFDSFVGFLPEAEGIGFENSLLTCVVRNGLVKMFTETQFDATIVE